ncbi:MAG TPA: beta-ketoacyl synthase N-terminal-like domain-containing protein [Xenococcaceae cyanobacterium]
MTENLSATKRALLALKQMQDQLSAWEETRRSPIAIVGLGCRFPGGADSPDRFWQLLQARQNAIELVPTSRWQNATNSPCLNYGGFVPHLQEFDAQFFRIAPKEALSLDPQQRLLLEVSWEALEYAAIAPESLPNTATGVFIGICGIDYWHQLLNQKPENLDAYLATGNTHSTAAGRLSYLLGLTGISLAVDTACSSSLVAVHLAVKSLREQECDLAIVGGVNRIIEPKISLNFTAAKMLSTTGKCQSFAAGADGFVRSEGCGVVILKRLKDAVAARDNILGVIYGSAVNQDGRTSSLTAPKGLAQQNVIRQALRNSNIQLAQIDYVEAHGTGTALGDPIEANALGEVFQEVKSADQPLIIGSVKTNIGHTEAAAGMAGLIKVILALQHQTIPANLHFTQPNPQIDWANLPLKVASENMPWLKTTKPRLAGVSAFGFSGTNAHLIVGDPLATESSKTAIIESQPQWYLLPLSARSQPALRDLAQSYHDFIRENTDLALEDLCYTARIGRSHFAYRLGIVAVSLTDLQAKLARFLQGNQEVAGVFTGKVTAQTVATKPVEPMQSILSEKTGNELGQLYVSGANIALNKLEPANSGKKIPLPTYPFQRKICWIDKDC